MEEPVLTPQDELLCHQLPTTFDHVLQSDLRWTERVVLYGFDTTRRISMMTGLARYPNRNLIDAYAMVTIDDTAHVVRLSRELDLQTDGIASWNVGPYTYEIVEPLKRVRSVLGDNDQGLRLQLDFEGDFPAYEQEPAYFRSRGRVQEDEIDPSTWWFGRDHSWGTRHGGGGGNLPESGILQPREIPDGVLNFMGIFQFDDHLVHFAQRETVDGDRWHFEGSILSTLDDGGAAVPIVKVEHDMEFRDEMPLVSGGTFTVHRADGSTREHAGAQHQTDQRLLAGPRGL